MKFLNHEKYYNLLEINPFLGVQILSSENIHLKNC